MAAQCRKCGEFEVVELVFGDQVRQLGCRSCDAVSRLPRTQQTLLRKLIEEAVAAAERDLMRQIRTSCA